MTTNDLQPHWEKFEKCHSNATVGHVKSILGEEISEDAFIIAFNHYHPTCRGNGRGRRLYRFLTKWNWIQRPE